MGMGELPEQARLAHPRLARHRHHLAVAGRRPRHRLMERVHLGLAAHERREAARGAGLETRVHLLGADQLEDLNRLRHALHRHRPERLDLHVALGQPQGLARDQGGSGAGELLHARGQVRGLADGRIVHVQVAVDGAHHDLARVEADADLHVHAAAAAQLLRVPTDRLLHAERGVTGAHRVVLVGERRAEERHDPVAHDLVDRALVAVHRFHHPLEHGIQQAPGFLRILVGQELHRALEIGEEHRDLLALAFERVPRGEDLLGEVLRGIALGRGLALHRLGGRRGAAGAAEALVRQQLRVAARTARHQARAALLAEPNTLTVLGLAAGTLHLALLGRGRRDVFSQE